MTVARDVISVILGEATSGSKEARFADMLGIASVIANRAEATNVTPQDVIAVQSQFNAYDKALPAGAEQYKDLAETAWAYVNEKGPVTNATFFATPNAMGNLPKGLQEQMKTSGHVYFSDPEGRSIMTAKGYRAPVNPVVAMPYQTNVTPVSNPARSEGTRYANPMGIFGARTTSEFGPRSAPNTPLGVGSSNHRGLDMTAMHGRGQIGAPVQSIASGTVAFAGPHGAYGNMVQINHDDGYSSRYAHLDAIPDTIAEGMQINAGTPIGTLGTTGRSNAPHLHLEVMDPTGRHVDPRSYVDLAMKAPPIPEANPNRSAPQMMAENPHQGVTDTRGMAPIARDEAPEGLMGYAPTQASAVQSAPQMSQAPTANPHAGVQSYQGMAPAVTVATTPDEVAAAEAAMNSPAFSMGPSMSQVADSRIDAAFSQPAQMAFNPDDANSAWGALSSVTPGLAESLAQAASHQGPASFNMAGTVYGNNAPTQSMMAQPAAMPTFNDVMGIPNNDEAGLVDLAAVPYSPAQGPVAPAQVAQQAPTYAALQNDEAYSPHGPASTPTFAAPVQAPESVQALHAFDEGRAPNNAPVSRAGTVAPPTNYASQAIVGSAMNEANPIGHATGGPVAALDSIASGLFSGGFGSLGNLGGMVSPHGMAKGLGGILGGAVLGPIGSMIGSHLAGGMFGPAFSPPTAADYARAMMGYTPGGAFPGAPAMGAGMLSRSGSNRSYSDMASISPAAAAAVADGTSGLY